jgi:Yip1 domain
MSANPTSLSEAQSPTRANHLARITGVFFSPKETFADIVAAPSWIFPTVLLVLLSAIACTALNQRMDWRSFVSQQIEKSPRAASLSPEQKDQQIEQGAKFAPIFTYVFGVPAPAIVILVVAVVMFGAYNLLAGADVRFSTAMGIVSHAFVPTIVSTAIFLLVLFLKPRGSFDLENPVATNLGVLVSEDAPKWLMKLGISFDIFSFWILILIAVGFAAANPRKLKFSKALTIAVVVWALFVTVRVGWAWIFS